MEATGVEPLPCFRTLLPRTDCSAWWPADVDRNIPDAILLSSLAGSPAAMRLVAATHVATEACLQNQRCLGTVDAHSRSSATDHHRRYGLLDLYAEAPRPRFHRHRGSNGSGGSAMGIPMPAPARLATGGVHRPHCPNGLSPLRHLRLGGSSADGRMVMATDAETRQRPAMQPRCRARRRYRALAVLPAYLLSDKPG